MRFAGLSALQVLGVAAGACIAMGLLYLLRVRRRSVRVVSVAVWTGVLAETRSNAWRMRFRTAISLLLQWALLVGLALALGDLRVDSLVEPRHFVLLVDASASMGAEDVSPSRLAVAKRLARRVIDRLGPDDQALIAQVDSSVTALTSMSGDRALLLEALEGIEVSHAAGQLGMGLRFAADCLRGRSGAEVVVVSDGAFSPLVERPVPGSFGPEPDLRIRFLPVGVSGDNAAITAFSVRRYPLDRARYEALAEVRNFGAEPVAAELSLWAEGQVLHSRTLQLPPGGSSREVLPQLSGTEGRVEAKLQVRDSRDVLEVDNRAYALLPERRRSRVLVVGHPNTYLDAALLLDEFVEVVRALPEQPLPAGSFDVTIFDGHAAPRSARLGALVYLGVPANGASLPVEVAEALESFGFDRVDRDSPLLRWIATENIQVLRGHRLVPGPGDQVVGASVLGPILVSGEREGQQFVALGFNPRDSDFVLRAGWPLFLVNCLQHFDRGEAEFLSPLTAGVSWQFPVAGGVEAVHVTDPHGVTSRAAVRNGVVSTTGKVAGFYSLQAIGAGPPMRKQWAVNPEALLEGDLQPSSQWPLAGEAATGLPVSAAGARSTLWVWLVLAAAVVGCAEWLSFHRRWTV